MADQHPDYPYAPDRFDREAEASAYHGAHRAEEPFWRQNLVYLIIIGAAVLTLLVLLFVIGGMGRGGNDAPNASAPAGASSSAGTQAPAEGSDGGGADNAQADHGTEIVVVNAGGQRGVAGKWRDELKSKDWSHVTVKTAKNRQEQAVVLYKDEKDAATAQALAKDVGADGAQQSDEYDSAVTFVAVDGPK